MNVIINDRKFIIKLIDYVKPIFIYFIANIDFHLIRFIQMKYLDPS